jgi:hypothetical protein
MNDASSAISVIKIMFMVQVTGFLLKLSSASLFHGRFSQDCHYSIIDTSACFHEHFMLETYSPAQ